MSEAQRPKPSSDGAGGPANRAGPLAAWTNRSARRAAEAATADSAATEVAHGDPTPHASSSPETQRPASDATFDLAPVGIMHVNKAGVPTRVNPELCELLGLSVREMVGHPLASVLHPGDASRCTDGLHRLITGRSASFVLEQRMHRRDGDWLWTQMNLAIVPGRDGADDYILAIVTDISRQKRAEENVRQINERLEFVISRAPIVLWSIDRHGEITMSRGAGLMPLGLNSGDAVGRSIFEMFADFDELLANVRRSLGGETRSFVARLNEAAYESFIMPVRDEVGEISGVIGVSTDVTARQRFADELAHRAEFDRILSGISSRFINCEIPEFDAGIRTAIEEVGTFCQVDRDYVFQLREDGAADMTHEWCAASCGPIAPRFQAWRLDKEVPWFSQSVAKLEAVHVPRVGELPRKAQAERKRLEARGVKSLLVVPMVARGRLVGFVGFERLEVEKSWTDDQIVLLTIFGEILANAIEHRRNRIDLLHARQELESRVAERTAELSTANVSLRQQIAERRRVEAELRGQQQLMEQLLAAHERDRRLVAYEIHDAIVQDITAALMHVEAYYDACRAALSDRQNAPPPVAAQDVAIERALGLLRGTIDESRRLITGLRPPIIDEMGVVAAIEYLVGEQPRGGAIPVTFSHNVRFDRLAPLLEGAIFRIVQEALANVQRHSAAPRAEVRLWHKDDRVFLEIRDWGVGFNPAQVTEHRLGLRGIRERARLLHGRAEVESSPGNGTRVCVELPIAPSMTFQ
ncbi:MAG: PAS domain S-box protein [Pirellulales bacterium]